MINYFFFWQGDFAIYKPISPLVQPINLLCVFPEIALQKLNEQKDIFTLGDWLVPALIGKMDVKSIWRKIQDHGWWQNDRNL